MLFLLVLGERRFEIDLRLSLGSDDALGCVGGVGQSGKLISKESAPQFLDTLQ